MRRAERLGRIGFLLAGVIFLIGGWERDGPVPPLIGLAVAGALVAFLKLKQSRSESHPRD